MLEASSGRLCGEAATGLLAIIWRRLPEAERGLDVGCRVKPERFQQIDWLVSLTLKQEQSERLSFIARACGEDQELRKEVESLISYHERGGSSLSEPAITLAQAVSLEKLGRYRIVEKIGAGGMGVVYRAQDERLEREVAVKVLPAEALADEAARRRFRTEAQALAKMNHPQIAAVYDFDSDGDVDFLVIEYVAGRALDDILAAGPLAEKEVARLGAQIARALEEAHEHGVVHRDLKPGNIMVTPTGQAKVLDFGLAKFLRPAEGGESVTQTKTVAGTPVYMAPERLRGEASDSRADIWGLGVVLHEMAAGQRPFQGQTAYEATAAILNDPPQPVPAGVSLALGAVIQRCLMKAPPERYQQARDVRVALEAIEAELKGEGVANVPPWRQPEATPKRIRAVAVLPLENLSGNPEQDYFADGMTEALITDLAKIAALRVISRTSVMRYKHLRKPPAEVAQELKVDGVVEGTVLQVGERVRITAQLIDAATDMHLWAESYERDVRDVFSLQGEVARAIAAEIRVKVTPQEQARLVQERSVIREAHEAYLRGRFFGNRMTEEGLNRSVECYERALAIDSKYALAYAGIADSYLQLGNPRAGYMAPKAAMPRARAAALRALELDNTLSEAHAALAGCHLWYDWDWKQAEVEFERALELNPSNAAARVWHSIFLSYLRRYDEARIEVERARDLDPISPLVNTYVAAISFFAWRFEEALKQIDIALEMDPFYAWGRAFRGMTLCQMRRYAEAMAEFEQAITLSPGGTVPRSYLGYIWAITGECDRARKMLRELDELSRTKYLCPTRQAFIHIGLGEIDRAFELLARARSERSGVLPLLNVEPVFQTVRRDPRFDDLLRSVGLPSS